MSTVLNNNKEPLIVEKIMFCYFPNEKRPRNIDIKKKREDKVHGHIEIFQIKN